VCDLETSRMGAPYIYIYIYIYDISHLRVNVVLLFHDYYILHLLNCKDASLKNLCTVSLTYTAYHLRSEKC